MLYLSGGSGQAAVSVVGLERRSGRELSRRTRRVEVRNVLNCRRCLGVAVLEIVIRGTLTGDHQDDVQEDCC